MSSDMTADGEQVPFSPDPDVDVPLFLVEEVPTFRVETPARGPGMTFDGAPGSSAGVTGAGSSPAAAAEPVEPEPELAGAGAASGSGSGPGWWPLMRTLLVAALLGVVGTTIGWTLLTGKPPTVIGSWFGQDSQPDEVLADPPDGGEWAAVSPVGGDRVIADLGGMEGVPSGCAEFVSLVGVWREDASNGQWWEGRDGNAFTASVPGSGGLSKVSTAVNACPQSWSVDGVSWKVSSLWSVAGTTGFQVARSEGSTYTVWDAAVAPGRGGSLVVAARWLDAPSVEAVWLSELALVAAAK